MDSGPEENEHGQALIGYIIVSGARVEGSSGGQRTSTTVCLGPTIPH